jgi:hypothetical protein
MPFLTGEQPRFYESPDHRRLIQIKSAGDEIGVSEALGLIKHGDNCWRHLEYPDVVRGIGTGGLTCSGYFSGSMPKILFGHRLCMSSHGQAGDFQAKKNCQVVIQPTPQAIRAFNEAHRYQRRLNCRP